MAKQPKTKPVKIKELKVAVYDEKFMGKEPEWEPDQDYTTFDIIKAYNWYNYILNDTDRQEIVASFVDPKDKKAINTLEPWRIPNRVASLCRMQQRGFALTAKIKVEFDMDLKRLIDAGNLMIKQRAEAVKPAPASTSFYIGNSIGDIEQELDKFYENYKSDFNMKTWLEEKKVTPTIAKKIADFYRPLHAELEEAVQGKNKDINEGYSFLKKNQLKTYKDFVWSIVFDCDIHQILVKKKKAITRKPRAPKAVSAAKLVKRLKYAQANNIIGVVSIEPAKLVGAKEAWLYNSKTRMLQHYVAKDAIGLQVKGTTLINYNPDESAMKKIRKPEIVPSFVSDGFAAIRKDFNALKVKPTPCNGRVNELTLILRAIK